MNNNKKLRVKRLNIFKEERGFKLAKSINKNKNRNNKRIFHTNMLNKLKYFLCNEIFENIDLFLTFLSQPQINKVVLGKIILDNLFDIEYNNGYRQPRNYYKICADEKLKYNAIVKIMNNDTNCKICFDLTDIKKQIDVCIELLSNGIFDKDGRDMMEKIFERMDIVVINGWWKFLLEWYKIFKSFIETLDNLNIYGIDTKSESYKTYLAIQAALDGDNLDYWYYKYEYEQVPHHWKKIWRLCRGEIVKV
jgi:hypothetical protein